MVAMLLLELLVPGLVLQLSARGGQAAALRARGEGSSEYCPASSQCGPGHEECGPLFGSATTQFHVRDTSCSNGDPNGMFYDSVHGLYHVFYQTFKGRPCDPPVPPCDSGTEVWGHVVSKDLATWLHLPAAIWSDHGFDSSGAWTGSTTLVNSPANPIIMFPGLTAHGVLMNLAKPANRSDPHLVRWASETTNLSATTDFSSAWQTADGDYLTVGHEGQLYRSSNTFQNWSAVPGPALWPAGDCPDMFELPRTCDGCTARTTSPGDTPTHVFKHSLQGSVGDVYQFGHYTPPGAGNVTSGGSWTALSGFIPADFGRDVHNGSLMYASKSFNDTRLGRRIWFGGVNIGQSGRSCLTLPREVTYNPSLGVLQFNPVVETTTLRGAKVVDHTFAGTVASASSERQQLRAVQTFYGGHNGSWPNGGRMIEIIVRFGKQATGSPTHSHTFGLCLGVPVGANASCPVRVEMHENSPVGMPRNVGNEQSRTMHVNGSSTQRESALATMGLLTGEQVIEARAFLDQTFVEIYVNKGRVTVTGFSVDSGPGDLGFTVFPGGGYVQQSVVAYAIDQAWVE